jgi:hypothetical protein
MISPSNSKECLALLDREGRNAALALARYLWPQHQRSHSSPELVDCVNTALVNQRVPVALICTDQFAKLKARFDEPYQHLLRIEAAQRLKGGGVPETNQTRNPSEILLFHSVTASNRHEK